METLGSPESNTPQVEAFLHGHQLKALCSSLGSAASGLWRVGPGLSGWQVVSPAEAPAPGCWGAGAEAMGGPCPGGGPTPRGVTQHCLEVWTGSPLGQVLAGWARPHCIPGRSGAVPSRGSIRTQRSAPRLFPAQS